MSQITIVDDILHFTDIAAAPQERSYADDKSDYQGEDVPLETRREEVLCEAHALTSIRISGHLPR